MTVPILWDEAVGRLRSKVSPQNYDMWLRPIELLSFDGAILRLRAPNSYVRLWFESNFLGTLLKEIHELGHDVRVEFDEAAQWVIVHRGAFRVAANLAEAAQTVPIPGGEVVLATRDATAGADGLRLAAESAAVLRL